jgi:hypothetical protein
MKWEDIKDCPLREFKRLTGVTKDTFIVMCSETVRLSLPWTHKVKGKKRGPKPKLSVENQILMLLMSVS